MYSWIVSPEKLCECLPEVELCPADPIENRQIDYGDAFEAAQESVFSAFAWTP